MTVAFLFPGQGSQKVGMAEDFCRNFKLVDRLFSAASERLAIDLRKTVAKGPPRKLAETWVAQPSVFVLEFGIATLLAERGFQPQVVLGHSLGEFAAMAFAGALDFEPALDLVINRGRLMHEVNTHVD